MVKADGGSAPTCLVVEDEAPILRLVTLVLREMGFDALGAPDAESALQTLDSIKPDLIITDVRLPGMNGNELARQLRADPELAATPIILMSAFGEPPDHNGDAFLAKPFDPDQLPDFLARYVH